MSTDIYYKTKVQNDSLHRAIKTISEMHSADNNRKLYKAQNYENTQWFLSTMYYLYYSVFFILLILLYFNKNIEWWIKLIVVVLFLVYPYLIYLLENWLYQIVMTIYYKFVL